MGWLDKLIPQLLSQTKEKPVASSELPQIEGGKATWNPTNLREPKVLTTPIVPGDSTKLVKLIKIDVEGLTTTVTQINEAITRSDAPQVQSLLLTMYDQLGTLIENQGIVSSQFATPILLESNAETCHKSPTKEAQDVAKGLSSVAAFLRELPETLKQNPSCGQNDVIAQIAEYLLRRRTDQLFTANFKNRILEPLING